MSIPDRLRMGVLAAAYVSVYVCACTRIGPHREYTATDCAKSCAPPSVAEFSPGFVTDGQGEIWPALDTQLSLRPCTCGPAQGCK